MYSTTIRTTYVEHHREAIRVLDDITAQDCGELDLAYEVEVDALLSDLVSLERLDVALSEIA